MNPSATRQQALELHRSIDRGFDRAGLHDLCFVLGIDDENLPGETKWEQARELALCSFVFRPSSLVS